MSPNIPFVLSKEAFDGFSTESCTEAGLRRMAVFCTDELKLINHFTDNEEIVIIPHEVDILRCSAFSKPQSTPLEGDTT